MSGYDKPIAGHGKFRRAKSCSSAGPAASSLPREDKNLLREMKMVPLPVGAWPKNAHSMRTDFWGNSRFTYGFFAVLFSDTFAL